MKKITLISLFLLFTGICYSQEKTFFHTELDIVFPRDKGVKYSYSGGDINIDGKVLWGANFSYNYNLFRKFSIGAVTGLTHLSRPSITSLKLGGILRYTFISEFQANTFLQVTTNIPITSGVDFSLGEVRFGFNMPIVQFDDFNLTLSAYVMYLSYNLNKPLFFNEIPQSLEYRGTGISLGARF